MAALPEDPYKILGVAEDAQITQIRSAHRKLALKCHPDKVQDAALKAQKEEEFKKIQQAYELLTDEKERQKYDDQVKLAELRKQTGKANTSTPRTASKQTEHESRPSRSHPAPRSKSARREMPPETDDDVTQRPRSSKGPSSRPAADDEKRPTRPKERGKHKEVRDQSTRRANRTKTSTSDRDVSGRTTRYDAYRREPYIEEYEMPREKRNRVSSRSRSAHVRKDGPSIEDHYEYIPPCDREERAEKTFDDAQEDPPTRRPTWSQNIDAEYESPRPRGKQRGSKASAKTPPSQVPFQDDLDYTTRSSGGSNRSACGQKDSDPDPLEAYYEYIPSSYDRDMPAKKHLQDAQDPPSPRPASSQNMDAEFESARPKRKQRGTKSTARTPPVQVPFQEDLDHVPRSSRGGSNQVMSGSMPIHPKPPNRHPGSAGARTMRPTVYVKDIHEDCEARFLELQRRSSSRQPQEDGDEFHYLRPSVTPPPETSRSRSSRREHSTRSRFDDVQYTDRHKRRRGSPIY